MSLIAVLDEWIIGADVALAMQLHAAPLAWLVAMGAVAIGAAVMGIALAVMIAVVMRFGTEYGAPVSGTRSRPTRERQTMSTTWRSRPVGARGARAPGNADSASRTAVPIG
ncbi:hypothetical protein LXM50_07725 [Microbacterium sp. Au-Mic1]|uniref:hypothetical protein n=1 Tax=Microbacterium sp. Au-Mic1 TaxID=2906457 RepID=UPI001E5E0D44|nr:hypothetical protein [Microbacterium sp. Au-Mic1]MCE4025861.1 hypothetical protein [Microbacterium sp. Au-Mic1]